MGTCDTCGNHYDKCFQVTAAGGAKTYGFDSFECAITKLASECAHCGVRIVGHGVEAGERIFCCAHYAEHEGRTGLRDRVA